MTILDLILASLCAFRLTQLLVWDIILDPLTSWLSRRSPFLEELLACAHCTGFWCSLATVGLLYGSRHWWPLEIVVWTFAVAGTVSIVQHATCWLDVGAKETEARETAIWFRCAYCRVIISQDDVDRAMCPNCKQWHGADYLTRDMLGPREYNAEEKVYHPTYE